MFDVLKRSYQPKATSGETPAVFCSLCDADATVSLPTPPQTSNL